MRYAAEITVPANTLASAPEVLEVPLCYGTIQEVELQFPAGQAGMIYVQVWRTEHQLLPTTPGLAFRGDDTHITLNEHIPIHEWPLRVELRGWSPGTVYDHVVIVSFTVLAEVSPYAAPGFFIPLPEGLE
jgi:hypothetical protein